MSSAYRCWRMAVLAVILKFIVFTSCSDKNKKDVRDFTDADFERLYEQWEAADEDKLEEDELPPYKQKPKQPDLDSIMKEAQSPEELVMRTKKGQSLMMFVGVGDVGGKPVQKHETERWISLWQSSLHNNHIDVQTFVIEDNRAIFMFTDGSKAWEAKDFLLKQPQISEVSLEGKQYPGPAARPKSKQEL